MRVPDCLAIFFSDESSTKTKRKTKGIPLDPIFFAASVPDCEYNRHREAVKALSVEKELKKRVKKNKRKLRKDKLRKGWYAFSGFPDIILHKRTVDETNILVLELKRSSNKIDVDYDDLKLQLFTRTGDYGYGYTLGAAIIASDEGEKTKRQLTRGILYHAGMEFTG